MPVGTVVGLYGDEEPDGARSRRLMRLLGQRPRYQEGPPRGPATWGSPVGGGDVKWTGASPDRSAEAPPTSLSEGRGQDERPEKARRIARSSSGHTARGRGFMK